MEPVHGTRAGLEPRTCLSGGPDTAREMNNCCEKCQVWDGTPGQSRSLRTSWVTSGDLDQVRTLLSLFSSSIKGFCL